MSSLTKSLISRQSVRSFNHMAAGMKVRSCIRLHGADDVKNRIACALSAKQDDVTIGRFQYSPSKLAARCRGDWKGKRFFAKIVLADPYPIPARFSAPWEISGGVAQPDRPLDEQIEAEWSMSLKMRTLSEGCCVPKPLGRSVTARTIVWEEATGTSLFGLMKASRWKSSALSAGTQALFNAGIWLRNVHEASHSGTETMDVPALIELAKSRERQYGAEASPYDRIVPKILEASLPEVGDAGTLRVPMAFTHGDFCLSNLLWDNDCGRLAVIDFELADFRPVTYDLFAVISHLRSGLLHPVIPKSVVLAWEKSFWAGYGPAAKPIKAFVKALALARIFYHHFYRLSTRRQRRGLIAGVNAQLYRTFLQRIVITRRLDLPHEFCPF